MSQKSENGEKYAFDNGYIHEVINKTNGNYCWHVVTDEDSLSYEIFFSFDEVTYKGCGKKLTNRYSEENWLFAFVSKGEGEDLIGYKNSDGEIIIPPKYLANFYSDTLNCVGIVITTELDIIGINRNDSIVFKPFIYENGPDYIVEGLFRIVVDGKLGFANKFGEIVIQPKYDFVTPFENGIANYTMGGKKVFEGEHWFWSEGDEMGFVNRSGEEFTKILYKDGDSLHREARTKRGCIVMLSKGGEILITLYIPGSRREYMGTLDWFK